MSLLKNLFVLPALLAALAAVSPISALAGNPELESSLREILAEFLAENPNAPGVSVCLICPPLGLDWSGAVGAENRDSPTPLTPGHTFRIASNTKTYVATAVLRLAEQGRLNLDDSLAAHLSAEQTVLLAGDGYDLEAMTLRQVLSHTSGLFEHPADPRYAEAILADPQRVWTPGELIRLMVEWGDPVGAPGERFSYSDTGYIILGTIVERLTGRNLGEAVHALLGYEALGLTRTWWELFEDTPAGAGPRAHQYYGDQDASGWHPSLDLYGGGGLLTDVRELALFTRKLIKGEVLRQEASLAAMTGGGTADYRLGLICADLDGYLAWGHSGFWNTFAFHVPALDLTVSGCVLNHYAAKGQTLAARLVERVAEFRRE